MIRKGDFATWASVLLAVGMLAGCDTGNQQQEPGTPQTEDQAGDNLAMYEPDDTAGDRTGTTEDPTGTARDPSTTGQPGTVEDPMMGADRSQQTGEPSGMTPGGTLENMAADQVVGKSVVSRDGEEIGDIDDVVTDPTSGQTFAVVDVGGFLGVGQKSIVIGLNELTMTADDRIQSQLTREELQTKTEYSPGDYESVTGGETEPDPTRQQ